MSDSGGEVIDFAEFENDVFEAFTKLFDRFQMEACKSTYAEHFSHIKRLCVRRANEIFKPHIERVCDMESLFDLLAGSKLHFNWIKIGFLKAIAARSEMLEKLLKEYESVFFPKKLSEVWAYLPCRHIRNKYYDKLKVIFHDKDPDNTTLREINQFSRFLPPGTDLDDFVIEFCHNCLSVTWLIPTDKVYQRFLSMLAVPQELSQEDVLQIGTWAVYHPQSVLQKLKMEFG